MPATSLNSSISLHLTADRLSPLPSVADDGRGALEQSTLAAPDRRSSGPSSKRPSAKQTPMTPTVDRHSSPTLQGFYDEAYYDDHLKAVYRTAVVIEEWDRFFQLGGRAHHKTTIRSPHFP